MSNSGDREYSFEKLISKFLDLLESKEAELLSWGIVDGGFSWGELLDEADEFLGRKGADEASRDFIEELERRKLVFRFSAGSEYVYRTRMASLYGFSHVSGSGSPASPGASPQRWYRTSALPPVREPIRPVTFLRIICCAGWRTSTFWHPQAVRL